ncbi:MAG TPA: arylsulfatase [Candidatus Acidoferrales bacterium]|nr:arylsulfatase [Candidatus Acidoferrales bacterium]
MKCKWLIRGLSIVFRGLTVTVVVHRSLAAASAAETAPPVRPNIVVILADDMGYSDLGCYGSEISTPNLDQLAKNGQRFTQYYTTPRCCPSRASLLTGLYPHQAGIGHMMEDHGVPGYRGELNNQCVTIAEALRPAGYHTLMVGKWHITHINFDGKRQLNFQSDEPFWTDQSGWPLQRGFEDYFGTIHGVSSYFDPFSLVEGNVPAKPPGTNFYYTDAIADRAVTDIQKYAGKDRPFFLYVAFTAPHWPMMAPAEDIDKYKSKYEAGWDALRTNRYERMINLGIIDPKWPLSPRDSRVRAWPDAPNKGWQIQRMATYAAMVSRLDQGVGQIMAKLKELKVDQNTLVLFASDNGACDEIVQPDWYDVPSKTRDGRTIKVGNNPAVMPGPDDVWQSYGVPWANVSDTPFRLYKHFVHEGGIASPLIASWPATIKNTGGFTPQLAHVTDIMATCLDAAGAPYPTTYGGHTILPPEGRSLLPVFKGGTREDHPIFWEHEGNRAVRLGKWKLVTRYPGGWELYDMEADRTELNNLAAAHPEKVAELAALYDAWAKRCNVLPWDKVPPVRSTSSD